MYLKEKKKLGEDEKKLTVSWAAPLIPRSWLILEPPPPAAGALSGTWDLTAAEIHFNQNPKLNKLVS